MINVPEKPGKIHDYAKHVSLARKLLIPGAVALLLASCVGSSDPNLVECNVLQKICYRNNHADRLATRQRFGVDGIIAIDSQRSR